MQMKHLLFITSLCIAAAFSTSLAQDNTQDGLPEGAIARLGKGGINIMQFSPDGTRLAVGTDIGVWLYDLPDGKETALFTERTGQVNTLEFSQDGKTLASGGFNSPDIHLWDLNTNNRHTSFSSKGSLVTIAFSQNNTTLTSLDFMNIIRWNVHTGKKMSESPLWDGDISSNVRTTESYETAVLSQDGSSLATGTREGRIRLWDTATAMRHKDLKGHAVDSLSEKVDRSILALSFSPDGKIIASGCIDNTVQLWDTEKSIKLTTLLGHKGWVTALAFSADGKMLASGDANKAIKLWDVDTHKERATLLGHKNTINVLAFAPKGTSPYRGCLASASSDGTIRFWDQHNGKELLTFTSGHTESVKSVAFSEDGKKLTTVAFNGILDVWNLKAMHEFVTFTDAHCDATAGAAISSDASLFARKGGKGFIAFRTHDQGKSTFIGTTPLQLWKITTGEEISGPWQYTQYTNALTFSPHNNIFVASIGNRSGSIIGWHKDTGVELFRFNTGSPHSVKLTFSPNGKLLATNGIHVKTHVWDITIPRELTPPNMKKHRALAFSPDNTILALTIGKEIVLYNITSTGIQEQDRIIHKNLGYSELLIFSPDGKILLNTQMQLSDDAQAMGYVIKLWDTNGNDLQTLTGHTNNITTLVFSPDGKTLASSSGDGTVLLWDWVKVTVKSKTEQN
ncbi:hypothetical protein C6497_17520 [Candidatus Poribacteria bacterium]|nr:MAG: hypothetical protein C6497_17520 [Candidatus Poribacteria bacterium]